MGETDNTQVNPKTLEGNTLWEESSVEGGGLGGGMDANQGGLGSLEERESTVKKGASRGVTWGGFLRQEDSMCKTRDGSVTSEEPQLSAESCGPLQGCWLFSGCGGDSGKPLQKSEQARTTKRDYNPDLIASLWLLC